MEKINLRDFTFLIPLRIDSVNRLENTLVSIDYIRANFDTHVSVLEASGRNTGLLSRLLPKEVNYVFIEDMDTIFHRTRYINQLVKSVDTEYLIVWDTDIIIPIDQINKAVDLLRKRDFDFVTPFKDKFLDTSEVLRDLYIQTRDLGILEMHHGKMKALYNPNPVGGAFLAHKQTYIDAGMENEKFYGWGREDGDRVNRWKILGHRHQHIEGVLYHLSHERGQNSTFHSPNQDNIKITELHRSLAMSKVELLEEISKWG
ncbi:glycosyltransferase family protein [Algoriphagus antarcticus]|jgi:predicted glycosyltransferase involved in capsule biosynthesis|uniref:Galactosyltransferase-like protein n=1 Tax=Algoriphagus antarcticus TaxID=238540 RepID=A0A3E0DNV9_9BACT|nr:galactosyltransferase-related protein [Algoriphagus antarcticus]REG84537.1 galactosyltransferase-like protein [Algoriphagus antarcticus]